MKWDEELSDVADLLLDSAAAKPIMIAVAVLAVLIMLVGFAVLWAFKLTTAVTFAAVTLLMLWALYRIEALDTEKYPWLILLPLPMFLVGYAAERMELNLLTVQVSMLSQFPNVPDPLAVTITEVLLFLTIILAAVGLVAKGK